MISGTWKINIVRSTLSAGVPFKSLPARIERDSRGEVFTLDGIETNGRETSYHTIVYSDDEPRRCEDFGCSGIQSSRRAHERTLETLRTCVSGARMRLPRRASAETNELVPEITEEFADGRRLDRRLTLAKQ
jgi:hypothetical protein